MPGTQRNTRTPRAIPAAAVAAVVAAGLLLTGCGAFGSSAPETITRTVTEASAGSPGSEGGAGSGGKAESESGIGDDRAPITVVEPRARPQHTETMDENTGDDAAADATGGNRAPGDGLAGGGGAGDDGDAAGSRAADAADAADAAENRAADAADAVRARAWGR